VRKVKLLFVLLLVNFLVARGKHAIKWLTWTNMQKNVMALGISLLVIGKSLPQHDKREGN
jgi:hypothetical protein